MSFFSGRVVLFVLLIGSLMAYALGYIHWNADKNRCFAPKHWSAGDWHTILSIGRLEFRYQARNYDCDAEWKLDPAKWHQEGDQIAPTGLTDQ